MPVFWGTAAADVILGSAGADQIYGQAGNDTLYGSGGNDWLNGGLGSDLMVGGLGDDVYDVDSSGDRVQEAMNEGHDRVRTSRESYTLAANVEDLVFTGNSSHLAYGNALDNLIIGGAGVDHFSGGAGNDVLFGNQGNDLLFGQDGDNTLVGGAGDDIYTVGSSGDRVRELAGEGTDLVHASVTFALSANVENLMLEGWESINGFGNDLDNTIRGNLEANILNGKAGNDILIGLRGDDVYDVDAAGDRVQEAANEGYDRVRSSVSFTLGANLEELNLTGTAAINGIGNALANVIVGNAGNNLINGAAGDDQLIGGKGDDIYLIGASGDRVVERAGEGFDQVQAWASHQLSANVEALILQGAAGINGFGNALNNIILGNAGNNVLNGGAGNDTLAGGKGDDVYDVDSAGDRVQEAANEGHDQVRSSVSFALGANLEDLNLTGAAINGTGNALANTIVGNAGANLLNGAAGDDLLIGGKGDDIYLVGAAGDRVVERAGEGLDQVQAWANHQLAANVETLILQGAAAINGFGNELNNLIIGNAGNNVLNGGAGNDTLVGGKGDDIYDVDSAGDRVQEAANEGYDRVRSSVPLVLGANLEELNLTGTGDIDGAGNALANTIIGNAGANPIYGGGGDDLILGGDGSDLLVGGTGKDHLSGDAGDDFLEINSEADLAGGEVYDGGSGFDTLSISSDIDVFDLTKLDFRNLEQFISTRTLVQIGVWQISQFSSITTSTLQLIGGGAVDFTGFDSLGVLRIDLSDLGNAVDMTGVDAGTNRVSITGGTSADTVIGPEGAASIYGRLGNDHLTAGFVGSSLDGGEGNDTLLGGAGNDGLHGAAGIDVLRGGGGDDMLRLGGADYSTGQSLDGRLDLQAGDVFDGGAGKDTLIVSTPSGSGPLDLSTVELAGLEVLQAYSVTAILTAAQLAQFLEIEASSIAIKGGGTVDWSGATLNVGIVRLSDSGNTLILPGADSMYRTVQGGLDEDTIVGGNTTNEFYGGAGNDKINGGSAFDQLYGENGDDVINGGGVADAISGGAGNDRLLGGQGDDSLVGGTGNDVLQGGGGEDSFIYSSHNEGVDIIADFSSAQGDRLLFQSLLHGTFNYLGTSSFTGGGNSQARFGGGQVLVDADGNGTTDVAIGLIGVTSASQLHASDFVFT